MERLRVVRMLGDNLSYVYSYGTSKSFVVDPGDAAPILQIARQEGLEISHIFITHGHFDHTAGVGELQKKFGCEVVRGGREIVQAGEFELRIIPTPGHSGDSVCFYLPKANQVSQPVVWTGDTLFTGGCGRIFSAGAETMWDSLQRIAALPDDTIVCGGHDYTEENYEFALGIEGENHAVARKLEEYHAARREGREFLTNLQEEKLSNIFLRCGNSQIKHALGMDNAETVEVFAELRKRKDVF